MPTPIQSQKATMSGFSLMELLIALMIIGVIATLGFKGYQKYADRARYETTRDKVRIMAEGLDQFYLQNGRYPDNGTWDQLSDANSPLVKKNMIPPNMPSTDPWGQPYEAKVSKATYEVKAAGDPNDQEDRGPIVYKPGEIQGNVVGGGQAKPAGAPAGDKGAAPAGGGR